MCGTCATRHPFQILTHIAIVLVDNPPFASSIVGCSLRSQLRKLHKAPRTVYARVRMYAFGSVYGRVLFCLRFGVGCWCVGVGALVLPCPALSCLVLSWLCVVLLSIFNLAVMG